MDPCSTAEGFRHRRSLAWLKRRWSESCARLDGGVEIRILLVSDRSMTDRSTLSAHRLALVHWITARDLSRPHRL